MNITNLLNLVPTKPNVWNGHVYNRNVNKKFSVDSDMRYNAFYLSVLTAIVFVIVLILLVVPEGFPFSG